MRNSDEINSEYAPHQIGDSTLLLPKRRTPRKQELVDLDGPRSSAMAALTAFDGSPPMNVYLWGPPGSGKTCVAEDIAHAFETGFHWLSGHADIMPEELYCMLRPASTGVFESVGSPLLSAIVYGDLVLVDEIDKFNPRAYASLIPLLDERRTVSSTAAALQVAAHPNFRIIAASNQPPSMLPPYLMSRFTWFRVDYPAVESMMRILSKKTRATGNLLEAFYEWASERPRISVRSAIRVIDYANRLSQIRGMRRVRKATARKLVGEAIRACFEEEEDAKTRRS
jgi:MoxR-like ATPase